MTAAEIVEALCEAQDAATAKGEDNSAQAAHRDRIKAALVGVLHHSSPCARCVLQEAGGCIVCAAWRKLEEACRGKA